MISDILVNERLRKQLTRKETASLSGMSCKEYSKIENGQFRKISESDFIKISKALDLPKNFKKNYVSPYVDLTFLKKHREKFGYTLEFVYSKTGISPDRISDMENGIQKRISPEDFEKLRKMYHLYDRDNYDHLFIGRSSIKFGIINDGKLGKLIKEKRESLKLTQAELAQIAGVDYSYIPKIEKNNRSVSVSTFLKLANVLEFSKEEKSRYLVKK